MGKTSYKQKSMAVPVESMETVERLETAERIETQALTEHFKRVREASLAYCEPLSAEDLNLQAAAFASPGKWHIAHTSWFFETFLLQAFVTDYRCFDVDFAVLFNSYYNGIGEQHPRDRRSLLSRPTLQQVYDYRHYIDNQMEILLSDTDHKDFREICQRTVLGIHHEQQHQELFFTDIKYNFSQNPTHPSYQKPAPINPLNQIAAPASRKNAPLDFIDFSGGLIEIGVNEKTSDNSIKDFAFDNESPKHSVFLAPFRLSNRLVSNAEYQAFIDDKGYQRPELWLADGWACVQANQWTQAIYWRADNKEFTLHGLREREANAPVCHISAYEADAYARWAKARLPTETEWEHAANSYATDGNFIQQNHLHPTAPTTENSNTLAQLFGDCWEWTSSAYSPYPGFTAADNAIGEYNGKFMCNQLVLRGGSCVTPQSHIRSSYRNFFYPSDRWQFSGIRLAQSL